MRHYPLRKPEREWRGTTAAASAHGARPGNAILERDGYRCTFINQTTGERCTTAAPARVETHHLYPRPRH